MQSATSFCNPTLFRKSMTRCWPLWASYGVVWLLALPVQILMAQPYSDMTVAGAVRRLLGDLSGLYPLTMVMAGFFGVWSAMAVFGYLYTSRSSCLYHSLPLRRETLFFTHYLAGFCITLLPNLVILGLSFAAAACRGVFLPEPLLNWFLTQCAVHLFFYSFAVFCAMFTGNILALPVFYGILNFLAIGIHQLLSWILPLFLYGYSGGRGSLSLLVEWLTPTYNIAQALEHPLDSGNALVLPVYAGVGVALTLGGLWAYRHRHVETAGDLVVFSAVRPIFRWGVGFCVGQLLGPVTCTVVMDGGLSAAGVAVFCLLWGSVGYFAADMLLRKTFRVFRKPVGFAVFLAAYVLFFATLQFDLLGYERRVPVAADVTSLSVNISPHYTHSPLDAQTDDPEFIAQAADLHRAAIAERNQTSWGSWENGVGVTLEYTLKSGQTLVRYYTLHLNKADAQIPGTAAHAAQTLWESPASLRWEAQLIEQLFQDDKSTGYVEQLWDDEVQEVYDRNLPDTRTGRAKLLQAIQADFAAGFLGRAPLFREDALAEGTYVTRLRFYGDHLDESGRWVYQHVLLPLTPQAEHTLAALEELGILESARPVTEAELNQLLTVRAGEKW